MAKIVENLIDFYEDKEVDGIKGWHWIKSDSGAWAGPKDDWENHHKAAIEKFVPKHGTVIQAGGNLGMYPKLLSRMFDNVHTFEPDKLNYLTLTKNCEGIENLKSYNYALGSNEGVAEIKIRTMNNVGMHQIQETNDGDIPIKRLDTFFPNLEECDLLMFDVEEYEFEVIKGAKRIIDTFEPILILERSKPELNAYLEEVYGYKYLAQSKMDGVYKKDK